MIADTSALFRVTATGRIFHEALRDLADEIEKRYVPLGRYTTKLEMGPSIADDKYYTVIAEFWAKLRTPSLDPEREYYP